MSTDIVVYESYERAWRMPHDIVDHGPHTCVSCGEDVTMRDYVLLVADKQVIARVCERCCDQGDLNNGELCEIGFNVWREMRMKKARV